jgi:hypothetical protein
MSRPKAMGIGAMLVLLIVAVVILPIIVRYVNRMEPHFVVSGFQDLAAAASAQNQGDSIRVPEPVASHSNFVSETPNGSGHSCPEGSFYDKSSNSCVIIYPGGDVPETGYFS